LFEIPLVRLRIRLTARDPLRLSPYKGSALRGGFGVAFRRAVCVLQRAGCEGCPLRHRCVYSYVFETPPPPSSRLMRKYPHAPHPFVIEPPLEGRTEYAPGEPLEFGLVLIGRAIDYLPHFLCAFQELGQLGLGRGRGRFELSGAWAHDGRGEALVFDGRKIATPVPRLPSPRRPPDGPQEVTLRLLTPLRVRYQAHLADELPFHVLVRALLRRISLVSYFHCGRELRCDFRGLIERAQAVRAVRSELRWRDWERYSSRQRSRMRMGGLVGRVAFRGELAPFWELLALGQELHVGKGTTFGLGWYRMEVNR